ncbi:MAG: hypothetical protein HY611_06635 [Elusimicrobia bacterium]|nr:hypothetical protein [Elusimicrobiota bacterium]
MPSLFRRLLKFLAILGLGFAAGVLFSWRLAGFPSWAQARRTAESAPLTARGLEEQFHRKLDSMLTQDQRGELRKLQEQYRKLLKPASGGPQQKLFVFERK